MPHLFPLLREPNPDDVQWFLSFVAVALFLIVAAVQHVEAKQEAERHQRGREFISVALKYFCILAAALTFIFGLFFLELIALIVVLYGLLKLKNWNEERKEKYIA